MRPYAAQSASPLLQRGSSVGGAHWRQQRQRANRQARVSPCWHRYHGNSGRCYHAAPRRPDRSAAVTPAQKYAVAVGRHAHRAGNGKFVYSRRSERLQRRRQCTLTVSSPTRLADGPAFHRARAGAGGAACRLVPIAAATLKHWPKQKQSAAARVVAEAPVTNAETVVVRWFRANVTERRGVRRRLRGTQRRVDAERGGFDVVRWRLVVRVCGTSGRRRRLEMFGCWKGDLAGAFDAPPRCPADSPRKKELAIRSTSDIAARGVVDAGRTFRLAGGLSHLQRISNVDEAGH